MQADGCPERFSLEFHRWIWRYPVAVPRLLAALEAHGEGLELVRLPSRRAANRLLADLSSHATEGGPFGAALRRASVYGRAWWSRRWWW